MKCYLYGNLFFIAGFYFPYVKSAKRELKNHFYSAWKSICDIVMHVFAYGFSGWHDEVSDGADMGATLATCGACFAFFVE